MKQDKQGFSVVDLVMYVSVALILITTVTMAAVGGLT